MKRKIKAGLLAYDHRSPSFPLQCNSGYSVRSQLQLRDSVGFSPTSLLLGCLESFKISSIKWVDISRLVNFRYGRTRIQGQPRASSSLVPRSCGVSRLGLFPQESPPFTQITKMIDTNLLRFCKTFFADSPNLYFLFNY